MTDQVTVADGKYTVINDNGKLTALRHGEPWNRDLTGDNLVYWMLVEILKLKQEVLDSSRPLLAALMEVMETDVEIYKDLEAIGIAPPVESLDLSLKVQKVVNEHLAKYYPNVKLGGNNEPV